ncbi:MAG: RagB/SusD family nutrient uptake outer membrane protein [Bacteroidales bacterium]|nr:RagB/SusD family nutrient uptake outer membrane protein [Bacteroidales bacterium]
MKHLYKAFAAAAVATGICLGINSCTDPLKVGNLFLEKAPGGTVTADTVFTNAEYTRQFLNGIYAQQYYALPTNSTNSPPQCRNYWKGLPDALSDTYHLFFANTIVNNKYYTGALTSSYESNGNGSIYPFLNEYIWENVRNCYILLERIDGNPDPGLDTAEKERMKDEARCLLASTYFTAFRFYGGMPIIEGTFSGSDSEYSLPRGSVEETVGFMVGLLDTVIKGNRLVWSYAGTPAAASETGRWTIASAMALKCKILQFAASPLFNDTRPYFDGRYSMADSAPVWYGNYDQRRWEAFRDACKAFIDRNAAEGNPYRMVEPAGTTQEDYAYAFRSAYMLQDSPEVIMGIRVHRNADGNDYGWINLRDNSRMSYCPTQEYVEMFPWADGTPFDWDRTEAAAAAPFEVKGIRIEGLDNMFIKGDKVAGQQMLQDRRYTRDPRLYETVAVNGQLMTIDWGSGRRSGANYETWVGGSTALQHPVNQDNHYGSGYRNLKYYAGEAFRRKYPQWVWLSLSEIYLGYAEAIAQSGGSLPEAVAYIDLVRARTGLKGLAECNPGKNLLSDKDALIEEILRERACEFALNDSRYFDMIRYKRADLFEHKLHRLLIYRLDENGKRVETKWYDDRAKAAEGSFNWYEPSHFEYERAEITNLPRIWWTQGYDPKWYLTPFPLTEINKGYGLIQNPGWE